MSGEIFDVYPRFSTESYSRVGSARELQRIGCDILLLGKLIPRLIFVYDYIGAAFENGQIRAWKKLQGKRAQNVTGLSQRPELDVSMANNERVT